jgi:hypothetical protein
MDEATGLYREGALDACIDIQRSRAIRLGTPASRIDVTVSVPLASIPGLANVLAYPATGVCSGPNQLAVIAPASLAAAEQLVRQRLGAARIDILALQASPLVQED